ncbi:CAP domain-containing protein [Melampsora americana]|nr:CAP domain-containing protein [Melampsora americana]
MDVKAISYLFKIIIITNLTRVCIGTNVQPQYDSKDSGHGISGEQISPRLSRLARRKLSSQAFLQEPSSLKIHIGSDEQRVAINRYTDSYEHNNIFVRFRLHQGPNTASDFLAEDPLQTMVEIKTSLNDLQLESTSEDFNYDPTMEGHMSDENTSEATDPKLWRREQKTASTLWVEWHNFYRRNYSAPDLTWDQNLAQRAQRVTNRCYFQHSAPEEHGPPYGENLFVGASDIPGVLNAWVNGPNEAGSYNPQAPSHSHFTQVVWRGSRQVGCAITQCNSVGRFEGSKVYQKMGRKIPNIACVYFPAGNVITQFPQNVIVPKVNPGQAVPPGPKAC